MIYLDYNATTPVLPEVLEAMMPYLTSEWGNPSSTYKFGSKLKTVIETARGQVAELIGAHATEIIFTSCATESNNVAIYVGLKADRPRKITYTSKVERVKIYRFGKPCCLRCQSRYVCSGQYFGSLGRKILRPSKSARRCPGTPSSTNFSRFTRIR